MFLPKDAKLECAPELHLIDRRSLVVEKDPSTQRDMKDRLNQVCACGKVNAHAAEYRGGEFAYVYLEGGPEHKIRMMQLEAGGGGAARTEG